MIGVEVLRESIYKENYFSKLVGHLTIHNEDQPSDKMLAFVEMRSKGTFINLSNKILRDGSKIYKSDDRRKGRISYRRDCDGICLLELGERNILLVIEVKSGFNEVKKKGFEQLVASYVKIRSILQSIDGYNPADYEELGVLVSYPPTGAFTLPATSIISAKRSMIEQTALDKLNNKNLNKLKTNREVTLNLSDYHVDDCHVNPSLYSHTLRVKHVPVTDQVQSETIDLDAYL